MILFYSSGGGADSAAYLSEFNSVAGEFSKNSAPIKAIAVPTSPLKKAGAAKLKTIRTPIVFCDWNSESSEVPVLLERFPVTQVPYLVMLDHKGVVSSVNVPIDEFEQEAGLLLDRR